MPKGDWIQTFTGRLFYPLEPNIEDIHIADIAHALSNICRFTGHCKRFYSVSEHSARMAEYAIRLGQPNVARYTLLHDAAEAYLCDVARPVKHSPEMEEYRRIEGELQQAIYAAFDLVDPEPQLLHVLDNMFLFTEGKELMPDVTVWPGWNEALLVPDMDATILGLAPHHARTLYMHMFNLLFQHDLAHAVHTNEMAA